MFTISHLSPSFVLGVLEIEIHAEVATLTGRFSKFPGAGYSSIKARRGLQKVFVESLPGVCRVLLLIHDLHEVRQLVVGGLPIVIIIITG